MDGTAGSLFGGGKKKADGANLPPSGYRSRTDIPKMLNNTPHPREVRSGSTTTAGSPWWRQ